MSHFVAIVLTKDCEAGDLTGAESVIDKVLAPYSENIQVDEYDENCYCINRLANTEAQAMAESKTGTSISKLRDEYWAIEEDARPEWESHISVFTSVESDFFEKHLMKDKPSSDCEDCNGTGVVKTTYNPDSKWDWYVIGGRWTAMLDKEYDPRTDKRNISDCVLCNGTGDRPDWVIYEEEDLSRIDLGSDEVPNVIRKFKDDWAEKCNGCNGCKGTGKEVNFSLVPFSGDVKSIGDLLEKWDGDYIPFAVVTPSGQWCEKGKMHMFACVEGEKDEDVWEKQVKALFEEHYECTAIVVDCHI